MVNTGNRPEHVIQGPAETDCTYPRGIDRTFLAQLPYDTLEPRDLIWNFLRRVDILRVHTHLEHNDPLRRQRPRGKSGAVRPVRQKLTLGKPMCLDDERITFPRHIIRRLYEPRFPLISGVILPVNDLGRPQFDALQLRVRIPDHSRGLARFVLGDDLWRLIDALALLYFDGQ